MFDRQAVLDHLKKMGISFEEIRHPAVFTIEEMDSLGIGKQGTVCKNLFLRDSRGKNYYLAVLRENKRADLKALSTKLGSRLSFASGEQLMKYLGLTQGSVTPLGVLNDENCAVTVIFDDDLRFENRLGVHPNDNTATIWISFKDLKRVVEVHGNKTVMMSLGRK